MPRPRSAALPASEDDDRLQPAGPPGRHVRGQQPRRTEDRGRQRHRVPLASYISWARRAILFIRDSGGWCAELALERERSPVSCGVLSVARGAADRSARRRCCFVDAVSNMKHDSLTSRLWNARSRSDTIAWWWRDFHLDTPLSFAHGETRLVVRCWTIEDATVVEGELGPMPRTHH